MLQSPSGLNVVTDSLLFICRSHCTLIFPHSSPQFLAPPSLFMSAHFTLVNHTRLSLLSQFPAFLSPASFCSVHRKAREQSGSTSCLYMPQCTVTPPFSLLLHISVSPSVHLCDCLFTFIFSCVILHSTWFVFLCVCASPCYTPPAAAGPPDGVGVQTPCGEKSGGHYGITIIIIRVKTMSAFIHPQAFLYTQGIAAILMCFD